MCNLCVCNLCVCNLCVCNLCACNLCACNLCMCNLCMHVSCDLTTMYLAQVVHFTKRLLNSTFVNGHSAVPQGEVLGG